MPPIRFRAAFTLALLTALVALVLRYETAQRRITGEASSCRISERIDCDEVQDSAYGELLGVSLATWGAAGATLLCVLLLAARRGEPVLLVAAGVVALVNLLAGIYTAAVSWFLLGKICLYCSAMHVGILGAALLVIPPAWRAAGRGIARPPLVRAGSLAAAVLALAVAGDAYARERTVLKRLFTLPPGRAMRIDVSDTLLLGDPSTPVSALVFFDFGCPHCYECFRHASSLVERFPHCVHFRFKHFPLDRDCNAELDATVHAGACQGAVAGQAARVFGKDALALKLLFDHRADGFGKLVVRRVGEQLGIPPEQWEKALASTRVHAAVAHDIRDGNDLDLRGVPVAYVNGRAVDPKRIEDAIQRLCR